MLDVYCPICKEKMKLEESKIGRSLAEVDGEKIEVTYLVCPNCDKKVIVQLDNEQTKEILSYVKSELLKGMKTKKLGHEVHKKKSLKFGRENRHLDKCRKELNKRFDGIEFNIEGDLVKVDYELLSRV